MPRPWKSLRNLGPHGVVADEIFSQTGKIMKTRGVLQCAGDPAESGGVEIPPLPKGFQPANLKLRYFLYCLAVSTNYELGREEDPSGKVAGIARELCDSGSNQDTRLRKAIEILVGRNKDKINPAFRKEVLEPQNILRFLKENMSS